MKHTETEQDIAVETIDAIRILLRDVSSWTEDAEETLMHVAATARMGENRIKQLKEMRRKNAGNDMAPLQS